MLKWKVVANMTKQLGYTASSLGNHEFDDGVGDLVGFASEVTSSFPLLACNLVRCFVTYEQKFIVLLRVAIYGLPIIPIIPAQLA